MKPKTLDPASSDPIQATLGFDGPDGLPIPGPSADGRTEHLLPYEKVAKAIYVRANGLPAYRRASGHGRRATDVGETTLT